MVKYRVESGYIILNAVKLPNANLLGRIFHDKSVQSEIAQSWPMDSLVAASFI